jgi:predicted acetyltransferase
MGDQDPVDTFPYHKEFDRIIGNEGIDLKINVFGPKRGVSAYQYHIVLHDQPDVIVGRINLRMPPSGFHEGLYYGGLIGYAVNEEYRGNHYAEKACRLIKTVALSHGMTSVTISCEPRNEGSRKTIESLGAKLLETVELPEHTLEYQEGERLCSIYEWQLV